MGWENLLGCFQLYSPKLAKGQIFIMALKIKINRTLNKLIYNIKLGNSAFSLRKEIKLFSLFL